MAIRISLIADTHLGFDHAQKPRIIRRRRGVDFFNNYQKSLLTTMERKADVLVHGGDMFFRSKIPEAIIAKAYEPLLKVAESGIQIILIPGNHERSVLPDSPLFHHPNVHVFDQPWTIVLQIRGQAIAFGGFPNVRNGVGPGFEQVLGMTGLLETVADLKILCIHQSVDGSKVGPVNFTFRKGQDVIGRDQIPAEIPLVLSGHIHREQILRTTSGGYIVYPGSIERTSFAEKFERKGFYLIDAEINDSPTFNFEFIELDSRPMIDIELSHTLRDQDQIQVYIQDRLRDLPSDSIVRIVPTDEQQAHSLTARVLRELAPKIMNIDIKYPRGVKYRED